MYRITITGAAATSRQEIHLSCSIETSTDGENWAALEGAPTLLPLPLSAVIGALRGSVLDADKRAALLELMRTAARSLPAVQGAVAVAAIEALLPAGWPVTVDL